MRNQDTKWKAKAIRRRLENEKLKGRLKELEKSREKWKAKYKSEKAKKVILKESFKKKEEILAQTKPKRHSFNLRLIFVCLQLRFYANVSLRGCVESLRIFSVAFGLELSIPSHSTIQNWEKKLGCHRLEAKEDSDRSWVIIVDESIELGQQKILLILGLPVTDFEFEEAASFSDVRLLYLGIRKSWNSEAIYGAICGIRKRGYMIDYGVADGGGNIGLAFKKSEIEKIDDCTHALGLILKKQYQKNEQFKRFSHQCGVLKRQVQLSDIAEIMPPSQRSKGRFLNIQPLLKWAKKALNLLKKGDKINSKIIEKLLWLKDYETLIDELETQCSVMNKLLKILKNKGLNKKTAARCRMILSKSTATIFFKENVEKYLAWNLSAAKGNETLFCCSDIIESFFGKYKNQLSSKGKNHLTDASLTIANYTGGFTEEETKKAMENVRILDLKKWRGENMSESLLSKRRKLFKNTG